MAYAKFDCACGCTGKVQAVGQFINGHRRASAELALKRQQATADQLAALLNPDVHEVPVMEEIPAHPDPPPPQGRTNQPCLCGCGQIVQHGEWLQGHYLRAHPELKPKKGRPPKPDLAQRIHWEKVLPETSRDWFLPFWSEFCEAVACYVALTTVQTSEPPPPAPLPVEVKAQVQPTRDLSHPPLNSPPSDGPPITGPIDHRRWRFAEDRPGPPRMSYWVLTRCHNCRLPMWTRDQESLWEKGGMCSECYYLLVSDLYEQRGNQYRAQQRTFHDPFRPR